jgi:RNA polymerase sigma-70 factor (ECF subfamily)
MTAGRQEELCRQWVEDHAGILHKVSRSFTDNPADREDLMQEILMQLWRSVPRFQGEAKVSVWVYRVAFNTAVIWRRGRKRRVKRETGLFRYVAGSAASADQGNPELIERLYEAIHALPLVDASTVLLSLDGVSYRDMAEILGISENQVGVKLNRAKKKLAAQMKGLIDDL